MEPHFEFGPGAGGGKGAQGGGSGGLAVGVARLSGPAVRGEGWGVTWAGGWDRGWFGGLGADCAGG